jgi:3-methyladenine DNA glycosylase/8-oxoguanine DNA glycosylase
MQPDVDAVVELGFGVDMRRTLAPLRRGPGDPTMRVTDAATWRTSRMPTGTVTYALAQVDPRRVRVRAWGDGAAELLAGVPDLLGARDDPSGFEPVHPLLADAHRRFPGVRVPATHRVMEALVPAIIEQKVVGLDAFASFRRLVTRLGDPAPGPAPTGMRVFPTAETWAAIPSWEWHRAGVGPERARTLQAATRLAASIERLGTDDPARVYAGLRSIRGIGVWTAAEVGQRALGDPDAVSIGDYHLPAVVGIPLTGRPLPEDEVEAFLEPWRPHRWRVFRLLGLSPLAPAPRRGPRMSRIDYRAI